MRRLLAIALVSTGTASATITIDPGFWDNYEPFGQYTAATIEDLIALDEGDLLDTSRGSDGLVVRIVGRFAANSSLISAKIALDSQTSDRVQVKLRPFALPRAEPRPPQSYRRPVSEEQSAEFVALLERRDFWAAPYSADPAAAGDSDCAESVNGWIIEGFERDRYQIIARSNCGGLDPLAAELRDFLLGLADVAPE